jgi:hypothetical protein
MAAEVVQYYRSVTARNMSFVDACQSLKDNSGAGIRTPDTRIMILDHNVMVNSVIIKGLLLHKLAGSRKRPALFETFEHK